MGTLHAVGEVVAVVLSIGAVVCLKALGYALDWLSVRTPGEGEP